MQNSNQKEEIELSEEQLSLNSQYSRGGSPPCTSSNFLVYLAERMMNIVRLENTYDSIVDTTKYQNHED